MLPQNLAYFEKTLIKTSMKNKGVGKNPNPDYISWK